MDNIKESSGILKFLYNTVPGRAVLKVITSPTISKIGGAYMDSKLSTIHIKGFIKNNNIDMSQYEKVKYKSFNEFSNLLNHFAIDSTVSISSSFLANDC